MTSLKIVLIDDHESILKGTIQSLRTVYPQSDLVNCQSIQDVKALLKQGTPDVFVMDMSLPNVLGEKARKENGIALLRLLLAQYPELNIVVYTSYPEVLIRLKPAINDHAGGFAIAPKSLCEADFLKRVAWALDGIVCIPKEIRNGIEVKEEWLTLLKFAFEEGLQDKAIATKMNISLRTVRNYWVKIQDVLEVYPDSSEEGKNLRVITEIKAREVGLID